MPDLKDVPLSILLFITGLGGILLGVAGEIPVGEGSLLLEAPWERLAAVAVGVSLLGVGGILEIRRARRERVKGEAGPGRIEGSREGSTPREERATKLAFTDAGRRHEIVMYWGFRPIAQGDVTESIVNARRSIFVAGMGLNTIGDILQNPDVYPELAKRIREEDRFAIDLVMLAHPNQILGDERGRSQLESSLRTGRVSVDRFRELLIDELSEKEVSASVRICTYADHVYPRHFLLQIDAGHEDSVIYVGSYLSHQRGKHSYLMKMRDYDDGLFQLFQREITYVAENVVTLSGGEQ